MTDLHHREIPAQRDAERVTIDAEQAGAPVDPPQQPVTFADLTRADGERPPIVPAWVRSPDQRRTVAGQAAQLGAYLVGLHLWRSPVYAAKVAMWAPVGAGRLTYRAWRWAYDMEQWSTRQHAANRNNVDAYLALSRQADKHRGWRVPLLIVLVGTLAVAGYVVATLAPWWVQTAAIVTGLIVLARAGRPADRPILTRVQVGPRFTRLTAEQVRAAIVDLGIGVKEPRQIRFPMPIHTDGPGYLARFDLPGAIVATKVLERRDGLAAALRLPVDQVWPEVGPDHPGQVDLWVGYQPSSKMGQPRWALAAENARTSVFEPNPFGTDSRQRPISTVLFERNFLIGGQPGSGKSYGARTLGTIAMLDPTVELKVAEFKGVGDFLDIAPMCSTYVVGVDDTAFETGRDIIAWALAECERRGKRILEARKRGEAPLGKITPELAAKPGSGLHPVVILLDEVHELFAAEKDAADMAERAIKRGRALGIIFILATQIPDKDSLPPNITRCVSTRWCMSVAGQVENDMILGTGAYKRGLTGTAYRPGVDGGWGVMTGIDKPGSVRSFFPDPQTTAAIVARATQLRGGVVAGQGAERVQARDMLADARAVLRPGESGLPWQTLADRLAETWPEFYAGLTGDMVRESLARYDVPSQDVKVAGRNVKGARRSALDAAQQRRALES